MEVEVKEQLEDMTLSSEKKSISVLHNLYSKHTVYD